MTRFVFHLNSEQEQELSQLAVDAEKEVLSYLNEPREDIPPNLAQLLLAKHELMHEIQDDSNERFEVSVENLNKGVNELKDLKCLVVQMAGNFNSKLDGMSDSLKRIESENQWLRSEIQKIRHDSFLMRIELLNRTASPGNYVHFKPILTASGPVYYQNNKKMLFEYYVQLPYMLLNGYMEFYCIPAIDKTQQEKLKALSDHLGLKTFYMF
eukprot:NODE_150_length_15491_cov_0.365644.p9 type:complete len:211 gc:universal NODE_150_length_15491_cov_0.365644:13754-14386(+)